MILGAQLFTVREFCKDLDSFAETLKKVSDMGYTTVQVSGTCEYDPKWLKNKLDENGLKCVLTHTPPSKLLADASAVAKDHDVFDCRCVGLGSYPFKPEEDLAEAYRNFAEKYSPIMDTLKANGKYFMYHNHDKEFQKLDGEIILAKMEKDFSADKLGFTLDTFWVQAGGSDPAYWIERLAGRLPCIHLKDYAFGTIMVPVGEGNINFHRIFEKAESAGTEYMLVEQDNCNGEDPFDCLKRSYDYLSANGFH